MFDWILNKLGLMWCSHHEEECECLSISLNSKQDLISKICRKAEILQDCLNDANSALACAEYHQKESNARVQREADYWRDECLKARGTK